MENRTLRIQGISTGHPRRLYGGDTTMTLHALQTLTWGTVTSAVVSALVLASGESAWPELSRWWHGDAPPRASEPPAPERRKMPAPVERTRQPSFAHAASR